MPRLIDADALIEDIVRLPNAGIHWFVNAEAVFITIDRQPTIDAVPVVRCKDCKWMVEDGHCREFADASLKPNPNDYCSAGVKKDATLN